MNKVFKLNEDILFIFKT